MASRFRSISSSTAEVTAASVLSRLLAGIGFRFYWATEGLTEDLYAFRPCDGARSVGETVEHIWDLLNWIYCATGQAGPSKPESATLLREGALDLIGRLQDEVSKMDEAALLSIELLGTPFWPVINGPLSDVLAHTGQIATLRRVAGSPAPDSNPFEGTPPRGWAD